MLYESENDFVIAYKRFMHDVAMVLTNFTSTINDDVTAIFEFEKAISQVKSYSHICRDEWF